MGVNDEEIERLIEESERHCDNGDYELALHYSETLVKLDPRNANSYNILGNNYLGLRDYTKAIEYLDKAIDLDNDFTKAYNNRGFAYLRLKYYSEAEKDFNKCLELEPNYAYAHFNKGLLYFELEEYYKSINSFMEASKDNGFYYKSQLEIAISYEKLKNYKKAKECYEIALSDPFNHLEKAKIGFSRTNAFLLAEEEGKQEGLKQGKQEIVNETIHGEYETKIKKLNWGIFWNKFIFFVLVGACLIILVVYFSKIGKETIEIIDFIKYTFLTTSSLSLILWVARYFNRREHEDIHIREEYEHRKILLKTFKLYGEYIKALSPDNNKPLLDFTEKVSTTINKSPANSLNRKKGDNIPVTEVLELMARIQKNTNKD